MLPPSLQPYNWLVSLVHQAGQAIVDHGQQPDLAVDRKVDQSPVTAADYASNELIVSSIVANSPFPIISEESTQADYAARQAWPAFWLVDPLDGTRSFANGSSEYAICIALVENGLPVLGCLHHPPTGTTWLGYSPLAGSAWAGVLREGAWNPIASRRPAEPPYRALGSKHHSSPAESLALARMGVRRVEPLGSALKFCQIAEGKADVYFRTGPTMEWDTAAGEALVRAAGGTVTTAKGPLLYNTPSLTHYGFLCVGDPALVGSFAW
jgi:3'(2'), 5'-bisphosphate nucleotidase